VTKYYTSNDAETLATGIFGCVRDSDRLPEYQGNPNSYTGYCYIVCEATWHLLGGAQSDWLPHQMRVGGTSHWYLLHATTREIVDPTAKQFAEVPDYATGRYRRFRTALPSKRAKTLMERYAEHAQAH